MALFLFVLVASAAPAGRQLPLRIASVLVPPVIAQAPAAVKSPPVKDSVQRKPTRRTRAAVSRKIARKTQRVIEPDTTSAVVGGKQKGTYLAAASFPVDLKKFVALAGSMGRLAGQMAISIDSAKLGAAR